jgi:hypothetical protein
MSLGDKKQTCSDERGAVSLCYTRTRIKLRVQLGRIISIIKPRCAVVFNLMLNAILHYNAQDKYIKNIGIWASPYLTTKEYPRLEASFSGIPAQCLFCYSLDTMTLRQDFYSGAVAVKPRVVQTINWTGKLLGRICAWRYYECRGLGEA